MLFSALILIAVDCEHDCLEQRVALRHTHEAAKVCNVSRLGLEEEEQVAVFLHLLVVREEALLDFVCAFEVASHFFALYNCEKGARDHVRMENTSSRAMRFWISKAMRESRYRTSFSSTKFFLDCDDIFDLSSRSVFCTVGSSVRVVRHLSCVPVIPRASSSSISRSVSFADMDKYKAVTE